MAGADWPLAVALVFISTKCTVFLGFCSSWIYTLLSLDLVGKALDLPQTKCLTLSYEYMGVRWEDVWREWEDERSGNLDWYLFLKSSKLKNHQ